MKNIKYYFLLLFLPLAISCGKEFDNLNVDPNKPSGVPPEYLLTQAERAIATDISAPYGPGIDALLLAQYWAQNNYTAASRFYFLPEWSALYAVILRDLREIENIATENLGIHPEIAKNQIAVARVLESYCFQIITDKWGPAPYSQALQGEAVLSPAWDTQQDIYTGILRDLKDAIAQMNPDPAYQPFGSGDILYGGDVTRWKRFAHSLLLRAAMRISDVEPGMAQTEVEASAAGAFSANDQNAAFAWINGAPNNNPLNEQRVNRGNADYGLSNILIDKTLVPLNDPRLPVWADTAASGGYHGRPYGQGDNQAAADLIENYSQPSGSAAVLAGASFRKYDIVAPTAPTRLLNYAEVCFIKAEASERGWNVGGTTEYWYNEGITASLQEWGISDQATIDAYLAQAAVAYATAAGDWKQKIGVQKWLALFMQGTQGWAEWRRLDFSKLEYPVGEPVNDIGNNIAPLRLPYPVSEQSLNNKGYQQGVTYLGGPGSDRLDTRLWWDVQ